MPTTTPSAPGEASPSPGPPHPASPDRPSPVPAPGASPGSLDALVDGTPAGRDRVVDLLRAASIGVVVVWHWSLSITHWHDGHLVMPNPVGGRRSSPPRRPPCHGRGQAEG